MRGEGRGVEEENNIQAKSTPYFSSGYEPVVRLAGKTGKGVEKGNSKEKIPVTACLLGQASPN